MANMTNAELKAKLEEAEAKLAEAEAKAAEAEQRAEEAEAKAAETVEAKLEEAEAKLEEAARVELYIPRGAQNDEPNLLISINGENFVLPKGKTSLVPPYVKAEYDRSLRAQERLDKKRDELLNTSKEVE